MLQLPELYTNHLKKHFNTKEYIILEILISLLELLKTVKLEELARRFPYPIQLRSRVKKLQRFLSKKEFKIETLWFPILKDWLKQQWLPGKVMYIAIDRSQWRNINLLMVSLIYDRRAIPVYFTLLPKKGNSNLAQQQEVLSPTLELLKEYKVVVLGDREFCSVDLANWLSKEQQVYLSLRLRKHEYVELEEHIWFQLLELGLSPGMSLYYEGVKVTKAKGFGGFNLAAKWRRDYRQTSSKEPWYILTNLSSLSSATRAYSYRMGIEQMFRDLKLGGYDLEHTQVSNERLISIILLITFAYTYSTFSGKSIQNKGVAKYVTRVTEPDRKNRRHSNFSIGLHSINWLESLQEFQEQMFQLLSQTPGKNDYYRRGLRAAELIQSAL